MPQPSAASMATGDDGTHSHRRAQQRRGELTGSIKTTPKEATAYIIRQLKRPDEVTRLRRVYGKQFVLVSAYTAVDERFNRVFERIQRSISTRATPAEVKFETNKILERDADEDDVNGQHIRDTLHLADVFVDGNTRQDMDRTLDRFIKGFFGKTDVTPTKDEYGMYAAKSASLRSADLSRQVGAAIFSEAGEVITQGCNEVPKAFGGTYWDQEQPDFRDVKLGYDPNDALKKQILKDVIERLHDAGMLSDTCKSLGPIDSIVATLTGKKKTPQGASKGPLADVPRGAGESRHKGVRDRRLGSRERRWIFDGGRGRVDRGRRAKKARICETKTTTRRNTG